MTTAAAFWDRIADKYSRTPVPDEQVYQNKLDITRTYFHSQSEVFEFGCGTGSTAIAHAPYVKHIHAIDISSKMLNIARHKADAAKLTNISFEQAAINDLTLPAASQDAVLGMSVLHLLENREQIISNVYDMLKPGGVFVTSTPCMGNRMALLKYIAPIGKLFGLLPILRVFTTQQLEANFLDTGFTIDYQWHPEKSHAIFIIAKKTV